MIREFAEYVAWTLAYLAAVVLVFWLTYKLLACGGCP
jgi:hypothetical protein